MKFTVESSSKILLCMFCFSGLISYYDVFAAPSLVLRIIPDLQSNEILLEPQPVHYTLIARVDQEDVEYLWEIEGDGTIQGDVMDRKIVYLPPQSISTETASVIITVTVTDSHGETAKDSLALTLVSEPGSIQTVTPTPPEPSSTPSPEILRLLELGDALFRRTFFLEPKEGNAFDAYTKVLQLDPDNEHARQKLREMTQHYRRWGDDSYQKNHYAKADRYYERYQKIAEYIRDHFPNQEIESEIREVQQRRHELEPLLTPPPTFTPEPTDTPTPEPMESPTPEVPAVETATPEPERDACVYVVKSGDVLSRLVQEFTGASGDSLYRLIEDVQTSNALSSKNLQIGQALRFPQDILLPEYQDCQLSAPVVQPTISPTEQPTAEPLPTQPVETLPSLPSSCPENAESLDTLLKVSLPEVLAKYQALQEQEQTGDSVSIDLVFVLWDIRCNLMAVEDILHSYYTASPDDSIKERLERIQATRKKYEQEYDSRREALVN